MDSGRERHAPQSMATRKQARRSRGKIIHGETCTTATPWHTPPDGVAKQEINSHAPTPSSNNTLSTRKEKQTPPTHTPLCVAGGGGIWAPHGGGRRYDEMSIRRSVVSSRTRKRWLPSSFTVGGLISTLPSFAWPQPPCATTTPTEGSGTPL